MKAGKFSLEFDHKNKLNENTFEFYFNKPKNFKFKSGQYIKLSLDIKNPDSRGSSRYFTISSSPNEDFLTITTRIIKSSFKKNLATLKKGDLVNVFGPIGYFDFNLKSAKPKIFLAGGIGVTPYHSILQAVRLKKNLPPIFLFASTSKKSEVVYFEELRRIADENTSINVVYALTKEKREGFEKGRIDEEMIEKYFPEFAKAEFFIVGSEIAEKGFLELVRRMGIPEENIFSENFPGY